MDELQIRVLVNQNHMLSSRLQHERLEMKEMRNQFNRLEQWGRVLCSILTSNYQEYLANGAKSELFIELYSKICELGQASQAMKDAKVRQIYDIIKSKETPKQKMIEQHEEAKIESEHKAYQHNFCFLNHIQKEQIVKIEQLTIQNQLLKRRHRLLQNYDQNAVNKLIEQNAHLCYCGGQLISLSSKHHKELQELRNRLHNVQSQKRTQGEIQHAQITQIASGPSNKQHQFMMNRLVALEKKVLQCKLNHKVDLDMVLRSQPYHILKGEAKQMINYISYLMGKIKSIAQYIKILEKERTVQIEELISYQKSKKYEIDRESLIEGSQVHDLLKVVKSELQQYAEHSKKITSKIKSQLQTNQADKQIVDKLQQKIHHLEMGRGRVSYFGPNHKKICFILHRIPAIISSQQCQDYLNSQQISPKQLMSDWNLFVNEYKEAVNRWDSFQTAEKYRQEVKSYSKNIHQITDQAKNLLTVADEKCAIIQKLSKGIEYKVNEIQFSFGEYKANEYFKAKQEAKLRKTYDERISKMSAAQEQIKTIMEDRTRILELVETQSLQHKQTVSELLTDIENFKLQIESLTRENRQHADMIAKWAEEKTRLKLEIEQLRSIITPEAAQEARVQQLKLQLDILRRKITCVCNRGHQATCALNCKHIFCKACVQSIVKSRKRCCPVCNIKFSEHSEVHYFHYN